MPVYQYRCPNGHELWEERHKVDERYKSRCPKCGKEGIIVIQPVPTVVMFERIRRQDTAKSGAKGTEEILKRQEKEQAKIPKRKQTRSFQEKGRKLFITPKRIKKRGNR